MIAVITTSNRGNNDKAERDLSGAEGQYVALGGDAQLYVDVTYGDIFRQFTILGWTAFGGPAAHIGLFQRVRHTQHQHQHLPQEQSRLVHLAWGLCAGQAQAQQMHTTIVRHRHATCSCFTA